MAVHPSLSHPLKLFEYLRSSCSMLDNIQIAEHPSYTWCQIKSEIIV